MSQIDSILNRYKERIFDLRVKLGEGIERDLRGLIEKRVPIDTETLKKEGITVVSNPNNEGLVIDIFVNNLSLDYGRKSIRAKALGMILDIGLSRQNKALKRTQSQPKNPAGSPTEGWFTVDFYNDVQDYLKRKEYLKWI